MQIIDPDDGTVLTTVGLAGRPAWSPDGQFLASLDNADGAVRVAEIATGRVRTIADLHVEPFSGDDCSTSGRVDWSPDGTTLLVTFTELGRDARWFVGVVHVDEPGQATLVDRRSTFADEDLVSARWLDDGEVMIVRVPATGPVTYQHADPWDAWPTASSTLVRPAVANIGVPAISPAGDRVAFPIYGSAPPPTPGDAGHGAAPADGSVVVVDVATGATQTIARRPMASVSFAPDGGRIGFVGIDPPGQVVIVPVGSNEASIAGLVGGLSLSWSPDGQSVATVLGASLRRLDLASGAVRDLGRDSGEAGGLWATEWEPV